MRFGQFLAQRFGDRPRDTLGQLDLVQGIAVALEEPDLPPVQAEDLVAVGWKSSQDPGRSDLARTQEWTMLLRVDPLELLFR